MDFLGEVRAYNVHSAALEPGRAALLVVDMQEFFSDITPPIVGNVQSLLAAARRRLHSSG